MDDFLMISFISMLFFMAMAVWKRRAGFYLFAGFIGIGFLYYTVTTYTADFESNEALLWLVAPLTLGALVLGFLQRYK